MADQGNDPGLPVGLEHPHHHPLDPLTGGQGLSDPAGQPDVDPAGRIDIVAAIGLAFQIGLVARRRGETVLGPVGEDAGIAFGLVLEGDETVDPVRGPEEGGAGAGLEGLGRQFTPALGRRRRPVGPRIRQGRRAGAWRCRRRPSPNRPRGRAPLPG